MTVRARSADVIVAVSGVAATCVVALTGCSGSTPRPAPSLVSQHVVIQGTAQPCLGLTAPRAGFSAPVVLKRGSVVVATQEVLRPFHFRFVVAPGDYTVVGLNDLPVRVHAGAGSTATVATAHNACD